MAGPWDRLRLPNLAGGLNTAQHPSLIREGETPDCLNVDFDGMSVRASGGNRKANNQTAVRPGLLVGEAVPESTLQVLPGKSAPLRSAVYIPYLEQQDIGGISAAQDTGVASPADQVWTTQRGRSFEINVSCRIPGDATLMRAGTLGSKTVPASDDWTTVLQGEELDEFVAIVQKGGDRLTPMSWALGWVNVGTLLDINVGGGLNALGVPVDMYADRRSNYALCFMWLDAPQFGIDRPVRARYSLANTKVYTNETTQVASSFGAYPTLAYRAFIAPFFAEPGKNHHIALRLRLDSGSPGAGIEPTPSWNNDGLVELRACDDYETTTAWAFDAANPADATLLRYKGPSDSLEYLSKYGIRWWGRDAMFVGLGCRFAPWLSAGSIPFGIDSAPVESGGFQLTDMSAHGSANTVYAERLIPEQSLGGSNVATSVSYDLRIAHNPAQDPTGTLFEINQRGLVNHAASTGCTWGDETAQWTAVGVQGKSPWGPRDVAWGGLGALTASPNSGFNEEALRSYRLVFGATVANGWSPNGAAGQMISIGSYKLSNAYGVVTFAGQHIVAEFPPFVGAPTINGTAFYVLVRAFRWNQRPLVVSDLRIFAEPREWTAESDYDLTHDFSADAAPGGLVGQWSFDDGGGQVVRESVVRNDGFMLPMGMTKTRDGGLFLSGEGEALCLDLRDNPELVTALRAARADGLTGLGIQITMRETEASYGIRERVQLHANQALDIGTGAYVNVHRFAPVLAEWAFHEPARNTGAFAAGQPQTADGFVSPPQPLLELSHDMEVEAGVDGRGSRFPLPYSLRAPSSLDHSAFRAKVPGSGATGAHAWYASGGSSFPRWPLLGDWVGRTVTLQIGLEPTTTAGQYKAYIAYNDGAEQAIFADLALADRDIDRSIITIGGAWSPRRSEFYDSTNKGWWFRGRSIWESCARMIVDAVTVYGCTPPGLLPAASGGLSPVAAGKTTSALSVQGKPTQELLEFSPGGGTARVTRDSRTVTAGGVTFSQTPGRDVRRSLLRLGDRLLELPDEDDLPRRVPPVLFASNQSGSGVTIDRPWSGPTQSGLRMVATRAAAATGLAEDLLDRELSIGAGGGFDIESADTGTAILTDPLFSSVVDLGADFRVRVYSNLGRGSSLQWQPRPARGAKLGRGNAIRGLFGFGGRLFAGSRGSLFQVDDRWRLEGDGRTSLAFTQPSDRAEVLALELPSLPNVSHGADTQRAWIFEAQVKVESVAGTQTLAWLGDAKDSDGVATFYGATRWSVSLVEGRPTLCVHSTEPLGGTMRPLLRYTATCSQQIHVGVWTHVRWVVRGNASFTLERPLCWLNGVEAPVEVDGVGDLASGPRAWIASVPAWFAILDETLALGAQRTIIEIEDQPTFSVVTNAAYLPLRDNLRTGWMHVLNGELCEVGIYTVGLTSELCQPGAVFTAGAGTIPPDAEVRALEQQSPVGEVVAFTDMIAGEVLGAIVSHPLISLSHSMGAEDNPFSWAAAERRIYVANGDRIGIIDVT